VSTHRSLSAWKFATSSGLGNCANAKFFEWLALMNARAALANLLRAERDEPGSTDATTVERLRSAIDRLEAVTMRAV
jgi:hypothetical protein